jgi:hypothetical protein
VVNIGSERNGKGISIYLNKKIRLFIDDGNKVFPRDGILKDFDEFNYYLEMLHGRKKGQTLGFLRSTVRRIEPLGDHLLRGGSN